MFDRKDLREQILRFVDRWVTEEEIVIGVLRYGAHIPHIYQNACGKVHQKPKKINLILSHMLRFFPPDFYRKNRFLILDDTVYEGVEMKLLLSTLIDEFQIPRERVRTATLVAHEQSDYEPDCPQPTLRLPDTEYVAWKEELASLVRRDMRPTERDHPLYYFEGGDLPLGNFLSLLQEFGHVHPVGSDWDAPVLRVSLTVDPVLLSDVQQITGVDLEPVFKVRLYWQQTNEGCQLTAAPMVFNKLDVQSFIGDGAQQLATLVGLEKSFFNRIYDTHLESTRGQVLFYFVGRSIAGLFLQRLLNKVIPRLHQMGCNPTCMRPESVDGAVSYVFPKEYIEFYDTQFQIIEGIVGAADAADQLPFVEEVARDSFSPVRASKDPLLPDMYEILEFMTRQSNPAVWDGARWTPNKAFLKGTSHRELVKHFGDEIFISAALDELLDSGLLRAKDISINSDQTSFEREFFPGGEYNAVQVSRIADSWRYQSLASPFDPQLATEDALDLWGPY